MKGLDSPVPTGAPSLLESLEASSSHLVPLFLQTGDLVLFCKPVSDLLMEGARGCSYESHHLRWLHLLKTNPGYCWLSPSRRGV